VEGYNKGFHLGGRYADDVITSNGDLQDLLIRVQNVSEIVGLLINSAKTNVMTSGKRKINVKITLMVNILTRWSHLCIWHQCSRTTSAEGIQKRLAAGAVLGKNIWGAWPPGPYPEMWSGRFLLRNGAF